MLDVLIALIQEEKQGDVATRHLQDQLLQEFLIPTVKAVSTQIGDTAGIKFYVKCITFLLAYLELEQGLLEDKTSSS